MESLTSIPAPVLAACADVKGGADAAFRYAPMPGVWDEMFAEDGTVREHWRPFHRMLCGLGEMGMCANADTVARLLRDHGVTYNAYQDTGAAGRPWFLDVMPVLIPAADFLVVERGLQQRIRLMRAIMADVYGSQRLIKESWVPPRMLFANPGFLRQVCDAAVEDDWIYNLATDLVRAADGSWIALADRCQLPGGIGYTLENRIVLSQAFPREFKECRVQRLAAFFEREREIFREMAAMNRMTPNVVMMTPGPHHRGYFEHAFKARYLGLPLVEGADLTVRDRRLFMKTLEGLRQVDVLIRRVEDEHCDTLELDPASMSGVPGLLEAWRNGRVKMANRIGSGVMEAAAWLPFLPRLCQELLGEELLIPSVPTWWCGQAEVLASVMSEPRRWVFKKAYCNSNRPALSTAQMDDVALAALLEEVRADPETWVAQEGLVLSSAPFWTGAALEPRSFVWRAFACGDADESHVMPGGLGRVSPAREGFLVSMVAGALSKDVWVLSDDDVVPKSLLSQRSEGLRVSRPPGDVPSRIADHLFWLGRYAERMEQSTRVLRMLSKRLGGEGGDVQMQELRDGLRLALEVKLFDENFPAQETMAKIQDTIVSWIYDRERCDGVADLMEKLRFNAAAARDRLSDDTWRLFNLLQEEVRAPLEHATSYGITAKLDRIILDLAAFSGMQSENMVQGHGWRFLEMGRRIERGTANATYLQAAIHVCETNEAVLVPLLEIFDSTMTYRRHHYAKPRMLPVLDLLLLHAANPRSLAFQLEAMCRQAALLPQGSSISGANTAQAEVQKMLARLHEIDLVSLENELQRYESLREICAGFVEVFESFSNQLTEDYFSHATRRSR
jgi:uncharacterized circularly permuted ATP-grasp superfamily protein/uncharacterized alpha-E superfamily protein